MANQEHGELEIRFGDVAIRASGPTSWIEDQFRTYVTSEKIRELNTLSGQNKPIQNGDDGQANEQQMGNLAVGTQASVWLKQYTLSEKQLNQLFHRTDDGFQVIAKSLPGKNNKEKTVKAFVLEGIRCLLQNDSAKFDHETAKKLCERYGCYDKNNHSANVKALENRSTGNVRNGFELTAPGLAFGAQLISAISETSDDS